MLTGMREWDVLQQSQVPSVGNAKGVERDWKLTGGTTAAVKHLKSPPNPPMQYKGSRREWDPR